MNILYYIPELNQAGGGTRQYAIALLKLLAKDNCNNYFILHNVIDRQVSEILKANQNLFLIPSSVGNEKWYENHITNFVKLYNFVGQTNGRNWKLKNWSYVQRICNKYKIDIVHSPFQFAPYSSRKTIWTLHDVQELHFPEYFSPEERESRARAWLDNTKRGQHIFVSYQHVKNDIMKYFYIKEKDISVCLLNMEELWFSNFDSDDIDIEFLKSCPEKYLLYPANTWKHKNHIGLIEAFKILKDKNLTEIKILCTGHQNEHFEESIFPLLKKHELHNQVFFMGVLEERKLFSLYKNTRGVVIPTKYEAGSFPLMESILLNSPAICSNVTSLPETIGNTKFVFKPDNYEEIANLVEKIWFDEEFRKENRFTLRKQKEKLINKDALNIITKIYSNL